MSFAISIDGPTAAGKTTLAYGLAREYRASVLDTGLAYRAVAYAIATGVANWATPLESFLEHAPTPPSDVDANLPPRMLCAGINVSDQIFDRSLDQVLKQVAGDQTWRQQIVAMHRQHVSQARPVVVVGRDVATTLLQIATLNVFLTAADHVRRERRRAQHRHHSDRSIQVGPATERDEQERKSIASRTSGFVLDSSFLTPRSVFLAVSQRLETKAAA